MKEEDFVFNFSKVQPNPDGTFTQETFLTQDEIPCIEANLFQKLNDPANGFSEGRTMRRIASIPVVAEQIAKQEGYDLSSRKDLERFLRDHPEYMTVEKIDSGRSGHIIIK